MSNKICLYCNELKNIFMKSKTNSLNQIQKIGLALGSGGARGLVHIGVLKAIEEKTSKLAVYRAAA